MYKTGYDSFFPQTKEIYINCSKYYPILHKANTVKTNANIK